MLAPWLPGDDPFDVFVPISLVSQLPALMMLTPETPDASLTPSDGRSEPCRRVLILNPFTGTVLLKWTQKSYLEYGVHFPMNRWIREHSMGKSNVRFHG